MDTELLCIALRFLLIGIFGLILFLNIYLVIEDYIKDDNFYKRTMDKLKGTINHVVISSYDTTVSTQDNAVAHLGTLVIIYGVLVIVALKLFLELLSIATII